MIVRTFSMLCASLLLALMAGCEQKAKLVYVLEGPQTVTLIPSASASSVQQGGTVVLSVERRTSGKWKQVPLNEVGGQCWLHRPPPESEAQVADDL